MDIFGLEARQSDLARGIVIVRCRAALDRAEQRALWGALAAAGITDDDGEDSTDDDGGPPLRLLAAAWIPPLAEELSAQRAGLDRANDLHAIEAVWFVKVETSIDGKAWQDLRDTHLAEQREIAAEEVASASAPPAEVLYSAPDVPHASLTLWPTGEGSRSGGALDPDDLELPGGVRASGVASAVVPDLEDPDPEGPAPEGGQDDEGGAGDDLDDDTLDPDDPESVMELLLAESHWRNGAPPTERTVPFPVESYPEVLDEYDWREFGIALKLGGTPIPGEDSVINTFFALWLSAYQDERVEAFVPFSDADVVHDRPHRSALLWVEHFMVPATPADQVHFLLWILHRLHEVVPVAWSRFDLGTESSNVRWDEDGEVKLILAGNPLAERARRYGEDEALSWAVAQSGWSKPELSAMLVEVARDYNTSEAEAAAHAERLLRRALAFDRSPGAQRGLIEVLVQHGRIEEAIALAQQGRPELRLFLAAAAAEHAKEELGQVLPLLDAATMEESTDEQLAGLAHAIALRAPARLAAYLEAMPRRVSLLLYLYNASFDVKPEQALTLLLRVLTLPVPEKASAESRSAMVMAWNNACIHAHKLGEYELARQLADGGLPYAEENPNIFHSAACAYAAIGDLPRALAAVRDAIAHDYEHIEKMETDPDLSPLHHDPAFSAIFAEWRHQRADLN